MKVSDGLPAGSKAELLAMDRMLERTSGFVLAFVAINHQALSAALIDEYVSDSRGRILAAELRAVTGESIVHQIGRCLDSHDGDPPLAMFVRGLEDMLEPAGTRRQYIEHLNYSRRYCSQRFPFSLIFWAPKYVLHDFSRRAQDFWSCRSDTYKVEGNLDDIKETVSGLRARLRELFDSPGRAEEGRALSSLLHDIRDELPPADDQRSLGRKDEYDELRAEIEGQLADLAGYSRKFDEREEHLLRVFDIMKMRNDLKGSAHTAQNLGQITFQMCKYRKAERYYQDALEWYLEIEDRRGQSECLHGLGRVNLMLARFEDAEWPFSEGLRVAQQEGYTKGHADACLYLGHVERLLGDNDKAIDRYRQAMGLYDEIPHERGHGNCLEGLGDVAWATSDYVHAQERYNEALRIAQKTSDERGEAGCKEALGHVAFMLAHYDEAGQLYSEALDLYRTIWHRRGEANSLRAIGEVKRVLNDDDKAREYFEAALRIYEDIDHRRGQADAIRALGHVVRVRDEYQASVGRDFVAGQDGTAEDHYRRALKIYKEIGSRWGQAACAEGLGTIFLAAGRHGEAESQYKHAAKLSHEIQNRKGEAVALRGLGDSVWALKRYASAAEYYENAQRISAKIGDRPGEAAFIRDGGDAAWAQGNYDLAAELYREALGRSTECGDRWGEADSNRKLGNIAWRSGDAGEAARLYHIALAMYQGLRARRLEAECSMVLGRLPDIGADPESIYGHNPVKARRVYTQEAVRILEEINAVDRKKEVSSKASLGKLIQAIYDKHWRQGDRPEHRML